MWDIAKGFYRRAVLCILRLQYLKQTRIAGACQLEHRFALNVLRNTFRKRREDVTATPALFTQPTDAGLYGDQPLTRLVRDRQLGLANLALFDGTIRRRKMLHTQHQPSIDGNISIAVVRHSVANIVDTYGCYDWVRLESPEFDKQQQTRRRFA